MLMFLQQKISIKKTGRKKYILLASWKPLSKREGGAGVGPVIQCADPRIQICIKSFFLILLLILEVKLEITVCALTGVQRAKNQRATHQPDNF